MDAAEAVLAAAAAAAVAGGAVTRRVGEADAAGDTRTEAVRTATPRVADMGVRMDTAGGAGAEGEQRVPTRGMGEPGARRVEAVGGETRVAVGGAWAGKEMRGGRISILPRLRQRTRLRSGRVDLSEPPTATVELVELAAPRPKTLRTRPHRPHRPLHCLKDCRPETPVAGEA